MMNQSRQLLTLVGFAFCLLTATASHADVNWSMAAPLITSGSRVATVSTWPVVGNANWVQSDIGDVGKPGSATFKTGMFTILGAGKRIYGTSDRFHFVYHPVTGDGAITARVASIQKGGLWAEVGVMIRDSVEPNARYVAAIVTRGKGVLSYQRTEQGSGTPIKNGARYTAPYWVRLVRSGDTFTTYNSSDGIKWEEIDTVTISMPQLAFVGFAVSSSSPTSLTTTTFDNIALSFHQVNQSTTEAARP